MVDGTRIPVVGCGTTHIELSGKVQLLTKILHVLGLDLCLCL